MTTKLQTTPIAIFTFLLGFASASILVGLLTGKIFLYSPQYQIQLSKDQQVQLTEGTCATIMTKQ